MVKKSSISSDNVPYILTNTPLVLTVVAIVIMTIVSIAWWNSIYLRPRNVFEDMLKNNLATKSITKMTNNSDGNSTLEKTDQLSFVPQVASQSVLDITQPGPAGETNVVTESIGTLQADYSKYLKIDTSEKGANGKQLDYTSVLNIWGKSSAQSGQPQNLQQSVLGLVPFANIRPEERQKIITMLINDQAYKVDYSKVEPKELDGYSALVFPVSIDSAKYLATLIELSKIGGYADLKGLDPAQYKDNPPIEVKMIVDKRSRKLLEVDFAGTDQKETYASYGLSMPIQVPENTIPIQELQQKIQDVK